MPSVSTPAHSGSQAAGVPNPEVVEKAQRWIYTAEYKLRILQETDSCSDSCSEGQIGAIFRHEGLYSSHLTTWRRQREAGQLAALTDNNQPLFPKQFGLLEDARTFCQTFFQWYNHDHHHSGIGLLTPAMLHDGQANVLTQHREHG